MAMVALPAAYPYTMLSATIVPFVTSTIMGGKVMTARKLYNVPLPNREPSLLFRRRPPPHPVELCQAQHVENVTAVGTPTSYACPHATHQPNSYYGRVASVQRSVPERSSTTVECA
jgi:hypothetical protein